MDAGRRLLLKLMSLLPVAAPALAAPPSTRMPVLFVGHGSPMNAIADNNYTRALRNLGMTLPKPRAILVISAHWLSDWVTNVQAAERPETLHDFVGFPLELDRLEYPAPGAPEWAARARGLLGESAKLTASRGLDHGAWSVLVHLFPRANIPVFQVSIDMMQGGEYHWNFGRALSVLRDEGVLIIGSGNIVHNLRMTENVPDDTVATKFWAQSFDAQVRSALMRRDDKRLQAVQLMQYAQEAVPTPDHYWPLIYALGASAGEGAPRTFYTGFQSGTISMRCLQFG